VIFGANKHMFETRIYNSLIIFLTLLFLPTFQSVYPNLTEQGWWNWYDQGKYLEITKKFLEHGLPAVKSEIYPPGYMVLSGLFFKAISVFSTKITPSYSIIIANSFLISIGCLFLSLCLNKLRSNLFLIIFLAAVVLFPNFTNSFIYPWSTSVSFCSIAYVIYYIHYIRSEHDKILVNDIIHNALLALFFSFLLHTRPQDGLVIGTIFLISFLFYFRKDLIESIRKYGISPLLFFLLFELLWFILADGLALGTLYSQSPHSLYLDGVLFKLFGLIVGDIRFGITAQSALDVSPLFALFVTTSIVTSLIFGRLEIKLFSVGVLLLYGSFSDFGPHNFITYELVHYFKSALIVGIFTAISIEKPKKLIFPVMVSTLLLSINLNWEFQEKNSYGIEFNGAKAIKFKDNQIDAGDILYISGLKEAPTNYLEQVFFNPPAIFRGETPLKPFKDYRVFNGKKGIFIHFFKKNHGDKDIILEIKQFKMHLSNAIVYEVM